MILKTEDQIECMREAASIAARTLKVLSEAIEAGERSLLALDLLAESTILSLGGNPAFKGYRPAGMPPYEWSICASVNEEVVHGIPSDRRKLEDGDIVGLDTGAVVDGWCSDTAITVAVGEIDEQSQALLDLTREGLEEGIKAVQIGGRIDAITSAIHAFAKRNNLVACDSLTGHCIGQSIHEPPAIPNKPYHYATVDVIGIGSVMCIEPMFSFASNNPKNGRIVEVDGWTIRSADRARVAHFEHMVAATKNGIEVLTRI